MNGRKSYLGCVFAFALVAIVVAVLTPVFLAAKSATRMEIRMEENGRVARAVQTYLASQKGHLPGADWQIQLAKLDPGIEKILNNRRGGGYAAVPGTLNSQIGKLPEETILYVTYHGESLTGILRDIGEVGDAEFACRAYVVRVGDVESPAARGGWPLAEVAFQLGLQGASGLKRDWR